MSRTGRLRAWRAIAAAVFILVAPHAVRAEEAELEGLVATVDVRPVDDQSASAARIVEEAIVLQLGRRRVMIGEIDPIVSIRGEVANLGDEIRVQLVLSTLDLPEPVEANPAAFEAVALFPLDINLDRSVAALVDDLLEAAAPLLTAALDRRIDRSEPEPDAEPASPAEPESERIIVSEPGSHVRIGVMVGFAPFIPALDVASYVGASAGASLLSVWYPTGTERVGVGLTGRYVTADASGAATSATLTLVPFGVVVRFSAPEGSVAPFARAAVGTALVRIEHPVLGSTRSVLPWAAAELGVRLALGIARFEFGTGAEAYLDGETFLVGFVPALSIGVVFLRRRETMARYTVRSIAPPATGR